MKPKQKNKLADAREALLISQNELGRDIGVTGSYIAQMERGQQINFELAQRISTRLNVKLDDLFMDVPSARRLRVRNGFKNVKEKI